MIRLIGAVLVGGCTTWLGISAVADLRRQARVLDELEQGIFMLGRELELAAVPLPQLLQRLETTCEGRGRQLFSRCRQHLGELEETSFAQIWREAINGLEDLNEEGRQCLLPLGSVLGRYGRQEQQQAIALAGERLGQARARAQEAVHRQGKVYPVLGLSGGAVLIILLL